MGITAIDVTNKRFNPTKFSNGYDQDEVDDFLDEIDSGIKKLRAEALQREALKEKLSENTSKSSKANEYIANSNVEEKVTDIIKVLLGEYAYVTDQKKEEVKQIIIS